MNIGRVRRARRDEVEVALRVWVEANPSTGLHQHQANLRAWAADPESSLFVCGDEAGELCGMLLSIEARENDGAGDVLPDCRHLTGLAVHSALRRRGVARALLDAAIDDARRRRCVEATLWTRNGNAAAQALFRSVGFERTGRSKPDEGGELQVQYRLRVD